ncbi:MAG: ABC transporter substrate-binding protein [Candidatus Rokubacteria bacterium]|nr:ABC transporter substrate-binding protein [Candidatus Rokubacteria bacterium]
MRVGILALALTLFAVPVAAEAQPAGKVARIGYLLLPPLAEKPSAERQAFLQGLRELGYDQGRNVIIEYRSAAWNRELLPDLAAELVERKVDVILAAGPQPTLAAREATKTIPIVMIAAVDPVESGLVASLARPGANVTGFTAQLPGLAGKRLELLREAVPRVSRVLVIWNPGNPATVTEWKATQAAARTLGIKLESVEVRGAEDFVAAFPRMLQSRPAAVVMIDDTLTVTYREILAEFALKNRVPAITAWREFSEVGGLMSYGPKISDLFRRAAGQVDKILKGVKPAELPVEQPTKFEFVINMRTAKALGLVIAPSLLLRADHVIE